MTQHSPQTPDALLLINTGCAHCPGVLQSLSELLKKGQIGRLEVINLAVQPERASELGARSVPWLRLGPFVLQGAHSAAELRTWVDRASRAEGMAEYISEQLEQQHLDQVLTLLRQAPEQQAVLAELIADLEVPMGVRIGVGAVIEELAADEQLSSLLPQLAPLLQAEASQVRADAAYYVGLSDSAAARELLEPLRDDPNHEVREIVQEALNG